MSTHHEKYRKGRHACKPTKYAQRVLPKTPLEQSIVVGIEHCFPAVVTPQQQDPELTGVWQDHKKLWTVSLNRAGNFVALWVSQMESHSYQHYVGKGSGHSFLLYEPSDLTTSVGFLGPADKRGELKFSVGETMLHALQRKSTRVTLSERAIDVFGDVKQEILRQQYSPISAQALVELEELVLGNGARIQLEAIFKADVDGSRGMNSHIWVLIEALGDYIEKGFVKKEEGRVLPKLKTYFRAEIRHYIHVALKTRAMSLRTSSYFGKGETTTRSWWDWYMGVIDLASGVALKATHSAQLVAKLRKFLDLPEATEELPYAWEFTAEMEGFGGGELVIGVSAFLGEFKVRQIEPVRSETVLSFVAFIYGMSIGVGVGIKTAFMYTGVGRSRTAWSANDFLGDVKVFENGFKFGAFAGSTTGHTEWVLSGSGGKGPITVVFGAASTHAIEAGVDVASGCRGYLREDEDALNEDILQLQRVKTQDYVEVYNAKATAGFVLGSGDVSPKAKDVLGYLAASELAAFLDAATTVRVVGSSDRIDTESFNLALSKQRAENVVAELQSCLGAKNRAKTTAIGLGESLAALTGQKDNTEDPKHRRVWVELNGRSVASLQFIEESEQPHEE